MPIAGRYGRCEDIVSTVSAIAMICAPGINLRTFQSVRITGAVKSFVILINHLLDKPRRINFFQDFKTGSGMGLDNFELKVRQLARPD